jgi:hypothetical protein
MPDPMEPEFTAQNPIVEAASRIRARRALDQAVGNDVTAEERPQDGEESLRLFARNIQDGCKRLNAILGARGVKFVRFERPLRLRLRFDDRRLTLELDDVHQLVRITGFGLDGDYQFDLAAPVPSLINVSKISTQAGYGTRLTASSLLKLVAKDAELPPPPHLESSGPLQF